MFYVIGIYNKHLSTTTKIENQERSTYTPFCLEILNFIRECLQVFIKI